MGNLHVQNENPWDGGPSLNMNSDYFIVSLNRSFVGNCKKFYRLFSGGGWKSEDNSVE